MHYDEPSAIRLSVAQGRLVCSHTQGRHFPMLCSRLVRAQRSWAVSSFKLGSAALIERATRGTLCVAIRAHTDDAFRPKFNLLSSMTEQAADMVNQLTETEKERYQQAVPLRVVNRSALDSEKMLTELNCKRVEHEEMNAFWRTLYDSSDVAAIHAAGVLRCGPLLYRMNSLDATESNLFIRDVYEQYYDTLMKKKPQQFSFVTGTEGVGKSCFRNYVMWRQIHDMKASKASGAIIAAKAPREKTSDQVLVMENGEIAHILKTSKGDLCEWLLEDCKLSVYVHVDCSEGVSSSSEGTRNFYYTSPNEKAWDEKLRENGEVLHLPVWQNNDLWRFYLVMGVNGTFLEKLPFEGEHDIAMSKAISEDTRGKLLLLPGNETVRIEVTFEDQSNASWCVEMPKKSIELLIEDEKNRCGPIPRNMFASVMQWKVFDTIADSAIVSLDKTTMPRGLPMTFSDKVELSLLQYDPLDGDIHTEGEKSWISSYCEGRVLAALIAEMKWHMDAECVFYTINWSSWALTDPSVALALLRLKPSAWHVHRVGTGPAMKPARIAFGQSNHGNSEQKVLDVVVVTNMEMERFMQDLSWTGIVRPMNKLCSPLDGVARFRIGAVLYTAYLQATTSTNRVLGDQGVSLVSRLHELTEKALESSASPTPHKEIWWWMLTGSNGTTSSLDKSLLQKLSFLSEEYVLTYSAEIRPV